MGNHLYQNLFFNKVAGLRLIEHLPVAASARGTSESLCSNSVFFCSLFHPFLKGIEERWYCPSESGLILVIDSC